MKTSFLLILLFASLLAGAQTTVTGKMSNPDGTPVVGSTSNYARFDLHYCGANQARISGSTQIPVSQYKVKPDASGHVSVSLYGNDVITCGTTLGGTRWAVTYVVNNSPGPTCEYNITGGTFDLNTQICDNVAPVVTPPTGDTVYARLDGGNTPFTGPISAKALNAIKFADQYGSIDNAVTACGSNPCTVVIPSNYSGAESTNYTASVGGYYVYTGSSNVTILDLRSNTTLLYNNYPITFGGRTFGQLSRFGVTGVYSSPSDSAVGGAFFGAFTGALPSNNGELMGAVGVGATYGTVTVGASNSIVAGADFEVNLMHAASDKAIPYIAGVTAAAHIPRTTVPTGATTAAGYYASNNTNLSTSGATFQDSYGFDSSAQSAGSRRNYGYHVRDGILLENDNVIDFVDSGGTTTHHVIWGRNSDVMQFGALSDVAGYDFKNTDGVTSWFSLNSSAITAKLPFKFTNDFTCATAAGCFAGNASFPLAGAYFGAAGPSITATIDGATGKGTFNGGIQAGASGSTISDTRELIQSSHDCGTTTTCANTANQARREVTGRVTLAAGTATVTGITAFTSTSSFGCTANDETALAVATAKPASTTSITVSGTGTDVIFYRCIGN